jgi:hypothetical protein
VGFGRGRWDELYNYTYDIALAGVWDFGERWMSRIEKRIQWICQGWERVRSRTTAAVMVLRY